jgi:hypothetical protein
MRAISTSTSLGHIFERSISDIEDLKSLDEADGGRRAEEGIYYTPGTITAEIVTEALGSWVDRKRRELGEADLPEPYSERGTEDGQKRLEFLTKYQAALRTIRVLDPACGSGAFLVEAFNFLRRENARVNIAIAELRQEPITGSTDYDIQDRILSQNLFGVDKNAESVEITKLALWLRTAGARRPLTTLDQSIQIGNSIISNSEIDPLAFDWERRFGDTRFDVVIGNPPWGAALSAEEKAALKQAFPIIDSSTPNSFAYFIGLAFSFSPSDISLVLPDSLLTKDFRRTRELLMPRLKEVHWLQNTMMPEDVRPFPDVEHDVIVLHCGPDVLDQVQYALHRYCPDSGLVEVSPLNVTPKERIVRPEYENVINLLLTEEDIEIRNHLAQMPLLGSVVEAHEGIHTGNARAELFTKSPTRGDERPLFYGSGKGGDHIEDYFAHRAGWYVDYRPEAVDREAGKYASLREERLFTRPKVYATRTGNPFFAFYDTDSYASNNFFSLQYKEDLQNTRERLSLLLLILNSRFSQYMIRRHIAPRIGSPFIETKIIHLLKLPFPSPSSAQVAEMDDIACVISSLKAERFDLTQKANTAVSALAPNCPPLDYLLLSNAEILKRTRLGIRKTVELLPLLDTMRTSYAELTARINRTITTADQTVYNLYGLTNEQAAWVDAIARI